MKILRVGHAMYLLKSNGGKSYLIDPFFDMNRSFALQLNTKEFYQSIDDVFLTHRQITLRPYKQIFLISRK